MKKFNYVHYILVLFCFMINMPLSAQVYVCKGKNGVKEYTTEKRNHCEVAQIGNLNTYQANPIQQQDQTQAQENIPAATDTNWTQLQKNIEQAQQQLEEGKKIRYGNERNYAKYQERIHQLEQNLEKARQELQKAEQSSVIH